MTKDQYIESLRKLKLNLYMFGEKVENPVDNPIIRPSLNSFAATYELAEDPQYEDLMTATSHISGKKINRFTHMHQSTDDLIKKVKMQRLLGQKTAACFQRCVGMDAMNAVFSSTYEIDEACGTKYHENFVKFLTQSECPRGNFGQSFIEVQVKIKVPFSVIVSVEGGAWEEDNLVIAPGAA